MIKVFIIPEPRYAKRESLWGRTKQARRKRKKSSRCRLLWRHLPPGSIGWIRNTKASRNIECKGKGSDILTARGVAVVGKNIRDIKPTRKWEVSH
jgi:hypothetical protein